MGKIRTTNKRRQRIERRKWHSNKALDRIWKLFGEVPHTWHRSKHNNTNAKKFRSL